MSTGIVFGQIVAIVCGHHRQLQIPGELDRSLYDRLLFGQPMPLDFKVHVANPINICEHPRPGSCSVEIP